MVKIALLGIATIIVAILFKKTREEYSLYLSIACCFIILLLGIGKLEVILDTINKLQGYITMNKAYMGVLIKIIGITYVAEFSSSLCKDTGYHAIGDQIELVGKLTILAVSMPILLALLETINSFLKA